MAKRFTAIILISNVVMGLLLYLSSQLVLSELNGATLSGFSIFSISGAQSFDNPPLVLALKVPNFPFYVFVVFLLVNAYFIIKLQRDKETKQNPS
jgi:hypothetical protein